MSLKAGEITQDHPLEFPAKLEYLYQMLAYIKKSSIEVGFSKTIISKIELAAEEALVNIINHGFPHIPGTIHIHCKRTKHKLLSIIIQDNGIAFNPLEVIKNFVPINEKDIDSTFKDAQIGGYGIYFFVNMMDHVDYQYTNKKNTLTLTKHFH